MEFTDPDSIRLAGRLVKYVPELFTFVDQPEVECTNNLAEWKIHPNVVIRKIFGGNRSRSGADAHANLMSLVVSSQQKGKDWFYFGKKVLNNFRDIVKTQKLFYHRRACPCTDSGVDLDFSPDIPLV